MLKAILPKNVRETSLFGLTQWDKGQEISIAFDNMPESFQVHFSLRGSNEAYTADAITSNGEAIVLIPDELLTSGKDIEAWIYITGDDKGETIGKITLYVKPRAEPKGYMEALVPSQQKLVENIIRDLQGNLQQVLENGVNSEYIPEYVKQEAQRVAKNVLSVQNKNTITFAALSDIHYDLSDYYSKKAFEHAAKALKLIRSMCNIDFAVVLGDNICDGDDKSINDAKKAFLSVNNQLFDAFGSLPQLRCIGGEDMLIGSYYRNGDYFDLDELYPLIGKWCSDATYNALDEASSYCYRDFDEEKYRVICLNTSDMRFESGNSTTKSRAKMGAKQLLWLCEALKLEGKEDPQNWKILIMSHYPANYYTEFYILDEIIKAYTTSSKIELVYEGTDEISCDFSQYTCGKIVALFNGELHNFKVNTLKDADVPMISIPNVSFWENNFYSGEEYTSSENLAYGEEATYNKVESSGKDTAFCIVTIDKVKEKIYAHCYGAGYDRTIDLNSLEEAIDTPVDEGGSDTKDNNTDSSTGDSGTGGSGTGGDTSGSGTGGSSSTDEPYTNLVATSVDDNEEIFNQNGYKNGFYLNSEGNAVAGDGTTYTGYIPCDADDVIYIKGGSFSSSGISSIALYDDNYSFIGTLPMSGAEDTQSGLSYSSGIVCFDRGSASPEVIGQTAFIRVSCECDGKDLIVTANEKIPTGPDSSGGMKYTNIVPFSFDENGSDYNSGLGYCNGVALDDTGSEVNMSDYTVTGYFDGEKGGVLRFKNYGLSSEAYNCLVIYDEYLNFQFAINFTSETDDLPNGVSFSNGVLTFDSGAVTAEEIPDIFAIRLSTKASGENLIVTYDEEIV